MKRTTKSEALLEKREASSEATGRKGDLQPYLGRLTRQRLLTFEEEVCLSRRVQSGDMRARDILVEANMRLVINIARHYHSALIPFEDLVQEGAIGLMTAAERYDPSRGYRFSTYATHWIKQAISRAIDNKSKAIRIPAHVSETLRKVERTRALLQRELGEEPGAELIAQHLGLPLRKVHALLQASQEPVSLDMLVGEEENTTLASLLNDSNAANPQEVVLSSEKYQILHRLLETLTPREREIMRRRLGMDEDNAEVLQEIGEKMHISRERVRQIEAQALKKLKYAAKRDGLYGYICD
ncbi:MAG: RNA polymerase sigma factor RpoD/SigA [Chloroherpetonaceae bacterium]|nr:RNA polymerase sigma factor RpoD/SigA [Chthonomonadaceae bacterium]MDW8208411.1 RNA polymerase sigma factor RpoD/SigA [Chloroherpetonaceae bacterium]